MAPKPSQQASKRNSQQAQQTSQSSHTSAFVNALEKISSKLGDAKNNKSTIVIPPSLLNPIKEGLRKCRSQEKVFEKALVIRLVTPLDSGAGHETCGRLDPSLYSIIIQIILQGEYCREAERALHLLAAALYYDVVTKPSKEVHDKKIFIGKSCLALMLEFFIDQRKHTGMRRWVGLTYFQLLQDCEENIEKVGMCGEDFRRSIGRRAFDDDNEIVRLISAQVIRTLVDAGIGREHLWPSTVNEEVYAGFPGSTEDNKGWDQKYQDFMDAVANKPGGPTMSGEIFFAQDVTLKPQLNFGTKGHNMAFLLSVEHLTIWAAATPDTHRFDQGVEIPLTFLTRLTIRSRDGSQDPNGLTNVHLELDTKRGNFCYLDCIDTVIHQVTMIMRLEDVQYMAIELSGLCPALEVDNEFSQQETGDRYDSQVGPVLTHSQSKETLVQRGIGADESTILSQSSDTTEHEVKLSMVAQPVTTGRDVEALDGSYEEDIVPDVPTPIVEVMSSAKAKGYSIVGRVKPKAKPPLKISPSNQMQSQVAVPKASQSLPVVAPSSSPLEIAVSQLKQQFPMVVEAQLRASLLASNINVEAAAKLLEKRGGQGRGTKSQTVTKSQSADPKLVTAARNAIPIKKSGVRKAKPVNDNVDWDVALSSEELDASTPRLVKGKKGKAFDAVQKQPSRYSLKPKDPIPISVPTRRPARGKGKEKVTNYDLDIASLDEEEPPRKRIPNRKKAEVKELTKSTSAPAILATSATGTRSKTTAAFTASQKINTISNAVYDDMDDQDQSVSFGKDPESLSSKSQLKKSIAAKPKPTTISKADFGSKLGNLLGDMDESLSAVEALSNPLENLSLMVDQPRIVFRQLSPDTQIVLDAMPQQNSSPLGSMVSSFQRMPPPGHDMLPGREVATAILSSQDMLEVVQEESADVDEVKPPQIATTMQSASPQEDENMVQGSLKDTPLVISSTPNSTGSSTNRRKRKLVRGSEILPKKRRSQDVQREAEDAMGLRRSPRVRGEQSKQQVTKAEPIKKPKSKPIGSAVKSPRMSTRSTNSATLTSAEKSLVDDDLARKQTVISFDSNGPRNQGQSSVTQPYALNPIAQVGEFHVEPISQKVEQKRKRHSLALDNENLPMSVEGPPKKRLSLSPPELPVAEQEEVADTAMVGIDRASSPVNDFEDAMSPPDNNHAEEIAITSSPPMLQTARKTARPTLSSTLSKDLNRGRISKQSFQASKVDENGSPIASRSGLQIDHIGKAKQRLLDEPVEVAKDPSQAKEVVSSGVFGTKIVLGSIPKARPSSPTEVATRYIPHKKTRTGLYEDVATNEVLTLDKKLADPFVEGMTRTSSGFTDRLLAGKRKTKPDVEIPALKITKCSKNNGNLVKIAARTALATNGNSRMSKRSATIQAVDDVEKTLVNSVMDTPSEMTSGSTNDSSVDDQRDEEQARDDAWNFALRPHYSKLSDAIHRIADEVIVRLADEEDVLGLLAEQYRDNGNKMIGGVTQTRDLQRAHKQRELGSKRNELIEIYDEAKVFVERTKANVERSNMEAVEKAWRLEQENIQNRIDQAQRTFE